MRWWLRLCVCGVIALAPASLAARPDPVDLGSGAAWELGTIAELMETTPGASLEEVQASTAWRPVGSPRAALGLRAGVLWLRLRVVRATDDLEPWRFEFSHPRPIALRTWLLDASGTRELPPSGLEVPPEQRPERSRQVVVPLPLGAGDTELYLRIATQPLGFSGVLTTDREAWRQAAISQAVLGLYYGLLLALLAYNLFLLLSLRDPVYAWYAGFVACTGFFFLARNGYIWGSGWVFEAHQGSFAVALTLTCICGFARRLLGTAEHLPRIDRGLRVLFWASSLAGVASRMPWFHVSEGTMGSLSFPLFALVLPAGVLRARQGSRIGRIFVAAWTTFITGSLLLLAKTAGLLPHTPVTEHAAQFGSALEMLLLSLALADRVRELDRRRADAEHLASRQRSEHERTVENLRAEALSRMVDAQDEERRRMAQDLHDTVGHRFLSVLYTAEAEATPPAERLEDIASLAREGMAETRGIAHDLYPQRLHDVGLGQSLLAATEVAVHAGLAVTASIDEATVERLAPRARLAVLRVAEEAIQNVLRHARARHLQLTLRAEAGHAHFEVTDDGAATPRAPGLGLAGMRDRATREGGTCDIVLGPQGSSVRVTLPLGASRTSNATSNSR